MEQYASIWPCYSFTPYLSVPYTDFKPPNLPEQLTFLTNKKKKSGYIPTYSSLAFTPSPFGGRLGWGLRISAAN